MKNNENNFKNDKNFCDGVDKFSEGCVENMPPIDLDTVDVILDQHEKQLEKIDYRVTKLEDITTKILIQSAEMSVKLSNIESNQVDTKKSILENSITLQNFQKELIDSQKDLVSRLIEKDTKVKISETENKGKVKTQTIITVGAIFTALISGAVTIYTFMHQSSKLVN